MVEWTTAKIAGLVLAITVLIAVIYFLYMYLGAEGSIPSNIETIWGENVPSSLTVLFN